MRYNFFVVFACAVLVSAFAGTPVHAQHRHRGSSVQVIARSPLLFGAYYSPYSLGLGQWYPFPYPIGGFPPGFYHGDQFSSVRLQVSPREALVFVDGYAAGIVDDYDGVFQRLQLTPGHHEVVVYLEGYQTLRQTLYLNPRSSHTIRHTLVPLAPGDAIEPPPVPRVMAPWFGAPVPTLPPAPEAARAGTLVLRVQPGDASVYIDDEPWGGPQAQDRLVVQLSEGVHRVRVEKAGFRVFVVDVEVRAGETTSFNVSLVP